MKEYFDRPVKLLATDLDGTLLDDLGQISKRNLKAIAKAKRFGITSVISTARSIKSVRILALSGNLGPLAVCQNGASIYDTASGQLISHTPIEEGLALSIISTMRLKAPGIIFAIEKLDSFIPENNFFVTAPPGLFEKPVSDVMGYVDGPVTKIICKHPRLSHSDLSDIAKSTCEGLVSVTSAGRDWVDFQALGVSKATGLAHVGQLLGYNQSECAAIGDQNNDVPMLHWANFSAATANACEEAKAAAHWLAPANTEHGVAAFIDLLIDKFNS